MTNLLLLPTSLLLCVNISADETSSTMTSIDALERQLEMGRHQQLVAGNSRPESQLAVFTTDGCSGGLSVGWEYLAARIRSFQTTLGAQPPWESCCITHDHAYHSGGMRGATANESFEARKQADLALKACVMENGEQRALELSATYHLSVREVELLYTAISNLMYRAVRIGGIPCTTLPWRWGYGWPKCEDGRQGKQDR